MNQKNKFWMKELSLLLILYLASNAIVILHWQKKIADTRISIIDLKDIIEESQMYWAKEGAQPDPKGYEEVRKKITQDRKLEIDRYTIKRNFPFIDSLYVLAILWPSIIVVRLIVWKVQTKIRSKAILAS